jgi:hypothetical protein
MIRLGDYSDVYLFQTVVLIKWNSCLKFAQKNPSSPVLQLLLATSSGMELTIFVHISLDDCLQNHPTSIDYLLPVLY